MLGKPSAAYFAAALDALDAEPELTWMVTDDIEADVRGAQVFGMRTALVRTGKFRPEALEELGSSRRSCSARSLASRTGSSDRL